MKELLVLSLGLLAFAAANQTPLQRKALSMVLDEFHSRAVVQSAFKEQTVSEVVEVVLQKGTFVQMEVELAQTFCRKHQRKTHSCRIRPSGKKQKCLACFKFDFSDPENVLDKSSRCLAEQSPIFQEVKRRQNQECESVRNANEDLYRPGQFAFSIGLPP